MTPDELCNLHEGEKVQYKGYVLTVHTLDQFRDGTGLPGVFVAHCANPADPEYPWVTFYVVELDGTTLTTNARLLERVH